MRFDHEEERGDTLLEIVFALVIIGLVVGAFMATYTTGSAGSTAHRAYATADGLLRNQSEALKAAVRDQCVNGATTYTTTTTSLPQGYTVAAASSSGQNCPAPNGLQEVTFTVTVPSGQQRSLLVEVRTP